MHHDFRKEPRSKSITVSVTLFSNSLKIISYRTLMNTKKAFASLKQNYGFPKYQKFSDDH